MDREQFWTLVESTSGRGCEQHAQRLEAELRRRYPKLWAKLPWDWDTFPSP